MRNAARPLPSVDHAAFLEEVTDALAGLEIGDGVIHRVCRDVQRKYLKPPVIPPGARGALTGSRRGVLGGGPIP